MFVYEQSKDNRDLYIKAVDLAKEKEELGNQDKLLLNRFKILLRSGVVSDADSEMADKEMKDDIQEVIRQFQEDLPALAQRLLPDLSSHNVPDFFKFPILAKFRKKQLSRSSKWFSPKRFWL